jgi:SAM-dependent methyltransferase
MSESSNFIYTGLKELEDTEQNLVNYNMFIVKAFLRHSNFSQNVLDFGAGIGTLASIWKNLNSKSLITCYELDKNQIEILNKRGFKTISALTSTDTFDCIFSSNVLEHIRDDQGALNSMFEILKKGGSLGIFVPANQILYSRVDAKLEHFRRYSKSDLMKKVETSGFKINSCLYVDFLGFFIWGLTKVLPLSLNDPNSKKLKFYDKILWPISRIFDVFGFQYLMGKNLLLLATKE